MMKLSAAFVAAAFLAGAVPPPPGLEAKASLEVELSQQIRARLDAYAAGKAEEWARFVAEDCLCGLETKEQIRRAIASRSPGVKNWYGEITDLTLRPPGEVVVARYRITEFTEVGATRNSLTEWRTETYVKRGATWMLVAGVDTVLPPEPAVARLDPRTYDDLVGRYQYEPGTVDTISREGDRLFVQTNGEPKVEIFPESDSIFFAKGEAWRLVFLRGPEGRVRSLVFRQQGQEFSAAKLP